MDLPAKRVWLPGAASCLLFFGLYFAFGLLPFGNNGLLLNSNLLPRILGVPVIPFLAAMPVVGALGAYLSRQMKGSVVERVLSALFPVFTFAALFGMRIVYGLFFEGEPYTLPHFLAGLSLTLKFIVAGGLLLALGAWPFCRPHLREESPK